MEACVREYWGGAPMLSPGSTQVSTVPRSWVALLLLGGMLERSFVSFHLRAVARNLGVSRRYEAAQLI